MYLQVRDGSTPVINAISFALILTSSILAVVNLIFTRKED
jgi:spermidine/putrescine transport system permease protein